MTRHRSLRDAEAKLQEFTVNAQCSPSSLLRHELNQLSDTDIDRWTPLLPRETSPVAAKCAAMPAGNGRRLHDRQRRPQILEGNPEEPIGLEHAWPTPLVDEDRELLAQG